MTELEAALKEAMQRIEKHQVAAIHLVDQRNELEAERDRLQEALRLKYGDVLAERDTYRKFADDWSRSCTIASTRIARLEAELDRWRKAVYEYEEQVKLAKAEARSWEGAAHEYEEQIRFLKARYEP